MLILKAFLLLGDVGTIVAVYVCVKETRADGANTHTHTQPITAGLFESPANRSALFRLNTSAAAFHKTTHT